MNRMQMAAVLAVWMLAAGAGRVDAAVHYVDASATGANSGSSWTDAYTTLQSALGVTASGDEVWVAKGTYTPGTLREDTFYILNGAKLYGGFTNGMATLAERSPAQHVTILSGDLSGNDTANFGNRGDNAYNVIRILAQVRNNIRIDGFLIRGGNADNHGVADGSDGSTLQDNGGGLAANSSANLIVANCTFVDNSADGCGAIWLRRCQNAQIIDCVFSGNRATVADPVNHNYGSGAIGGSGNNRPIDNTRIERCIFTGNTTGERGGVMYDTNAQWPVDFVNCVMAGNTATENGGSVYLRNGTNFLQHCTIAGNSPDGIYIHGTTNIYIRNTIIWTNDAPGGPGTSEVDVNGGNANPAFSDINRASFAGVNGTIQATPQWVSGTSSTWSAAATYQPARGISTLTRASATWTANAFAGMTINPDTAQKRQFLISSNSTTQIYVWGDVSGFAGNGDTFRIWNYQLANGSPCIDTGTNLTPAVTNDVTQGTRPKGVLPDMGAYESTATGSVAGVIYVNDNATGLNNGSSWQHAYTNLSQALSVALEGNQIWVAGGTYKPGAARTDTFTLKHLVPIYGGFAGTESSVSQRDIAANPTILTGDLSGNDTANFGNRADNAYHVVTTLPNQSRNIRFDGFIVRGGQADSGTAFDVNGQGGGMFTENPNNLTIANCVFADNVAIGGGGLYIKRPLQTGIRIEDSVFSGNRATEAGNNRGGGAISGQGNSSTTVLDRVVFTGNRAQDGVGGGLAYAPTEPLGVTIASSLVAGNLSGYNDGGGAQGGGLMLRSNAVATVVNSTLAYNQPYGITSKDQIPNVHNSIVWNNTTGELLVLNGSVSAQHSDIDETGYDGLNGNIRQDPVWAASSTGAILTVSYTPATGRSLITASGVTWIAGQHSGKSVNPDIAQNLQFWIATNGVNTLTVWGDVTAAGAAIADTFRIHNYRIVRGSPCVDTGTTTNAPVLDLDRNPRLIGESVDMGAYELASAGGLIVYVDKDATGLNDGTSWSNAFTDLKAALASAAGGRQIWVAEGTYKPGLLPTDTFQLRATISVYGGFLGTETALTERNSAANLTILSGDLLGNDASDNLISAPHANRADNARHVVTGVDGATLDGFVIIGGYAYDAGDAEFGGGGLLANGTSPTIVDCRFVDNFGRKGGAISVLGAGAPTIQRCSFGGNWAENAGAVYSAGAPTFDRCIVAGSTATNAGDSTGGAFYFEGAAQPLLQNALIVGNYSEFDGAIRVDGNLGSNSVRIVNSTIARNTGEATGAMFIKRACQPWIVNSILWRNDTLALGGADEIGIDGVTPGSVVVRYSDVSGGFTGTGNINTNPAFLAQFTGNWTSVGAFDTTRRQTTLTRAGAGWLPNQLAGFVVNPNTNQWRHFEVVSNTTTSLTVWGNAALVSTAGSAYIAQDYDIISSSPVVDAGTPVGAPNRDLEGDPRPRGGGFDMGAYEYQSLASLGLMFIVK